jgi:predicted MFS family arabinose efflux permease
VLTAGGSTGQLAFLPILANLAGTYGWRWAALAVAGSALLVVPLVWAFLRDHPAQVGTTAYGATEPEPLPAPTRGAARRALGALRDASRTGMFWLLAGSFAICGATTNGLIGTHFIPAAHDHGMPQTTAAGLLALVGLFDIAGTVASGWLTDRYDSRVLLGAYYALRGVSLLVLPSLLAATLHPSVLVFVLFYGLDWIATVPPTITLCRERFGAAGPVVFGWVFAAHQVGAAVAASAAGLIHDRTGGYDLAFYLAGGLALGAAVLSVGIRRPGVRWTVAFQE